MYLVYINYDGKADRLGETMLIYHTGPSEIMPWCKRDGYRCSNSKRITIWQGDMKERYILGDFRDAYTACQFAKRIDKLAKGYGFEQIVKIATEFDIELRKRALAYVGRRKRLELAVQKAIEASANDRWDAYE